MDDKQNQASQDPEERAFSGHPDHPPAQSDQPTRGNEELLRDPGESEQEDEGSSSPGDQGTNLPGYG